MRKFLSVASGLIVLAAASIVATGCDTNSGSYYAPPPGKVAVVRGKPSGYDTHTKGTKIERVICPDSNQAHIGQDREVHPYNEMRSQRYYLVTTDPGRGDRPTADFFEGTTGDGVKVHIEGKFLFHTNLGCGGQAEKLLRDFDTQYGSRKFPLVGSGGTDSSPSASPWDGSPGWDAFLDSNVRTSMDNVVPLAVKQFTCADLNTSCAVISNAKGGKALVDAAQGKASTAQIEALQAAIVKALNDQLATDMGEKYLTFTDFRIAKVTLPANVQAAVDNAQAEYAKLSGKQAELDNAKLEAEKQALLAQAYEKSPALLQLEIAKIKAQEIKDLLTAQGKGKIDHLYFDTPPGR